MFRHDLSRSGAVGSLPHAPTQCWVYSTNVSVHACPVVVDGVVYVGSYDGNVYAIVEKELMPSSSPAASLQS